jgi:hypothetical protein
MGLYRVALNSRSLSNNEAAEIEAQQLLGTALQHQVVRRKPSIPYTPLRPRHRIRFWAMQPWGVRTGRWNN